MPSGLPAQQYLDGLRDRYYWAQQASKLDGFNLVMHVAWDSRIAKLDLGEAVGSRSAGAGSDALASSFLINQQLLDLLAARIQGKKNVTMHDLRQVAINADDAVRPTFSADALNDINASYYQSEVAFDPSAGLATMYDDNVPLNLALGKLLGSITRSKNENTGQLRVKELCAGNNTAHWRYIAQGAVDAGARHIDVALSDFFAPRIDKKARTRHSTIKAELYSLFDDQSVLLPKQRFDAIVTTYGFDSVWLPEDIHISRVRKKWYQTLYRVKVADWHPHRSKLIEMLRKGQPLKDATAADYDGIVVEHILKPLNMKNHPLRAILKKHSKSSFTIPGGLVKRVVEAFEAQLTPDGIFVSCDMGDFGHMGSESSLWPPHAKSGVAARYHPGDYILAKTILEDTYNLEVDLFSLEQFVSQYFGPHWRQKASRVEIYQIEHGLTNGVMVARRRR